MRTVEIKTKEQKILVVDLPKGVSTKDRRILLANAISKFKTDFKAIGFASSLSEKEWAGILGNTTESGKSWPEANGIADFENPFLLIKK